MKRAFDASLAAALVESQLAAIESKTGAQMLKRDNLGRPRGVTLTGWSALIGITALVVMLLGGATYGWRHYSGWVDPSTVVLKARQGYKRVSTSAS